jgi:prepilin-type processing-associated H-X9-DG protein
MRRASILDVVVIIGAVAIVVAALGPAVARVQRLSAEARCQSNMQRWAEAMELYSAENSSRYPSNRIIQSNGSLSAIQWECNLSRQDTATGEPLIDPSTGDPYRFDYSINWVEALYPYLWDRAEKTGLDWKSWRRCPNAGTTKRPSPYNCGVTYSFNATLVEYWPGIVRHPEKMMMLRELSWVAPAELRPTNWSGCFNSDPAYSPMYAFLTYKDVTTPSGQKDNANLHGGGSYIMFADGHVKHFTAEFYPERTSDWASHAFDPETKQWYNWVYANPANDTERMLNRTIAITP